MIKVGIIGGSGYTGSELLRLLSMHPKVEVHKVTSRKWRDKPVCSLHKFLNGFYSDLKFISPNLKDLSDCDVVFTAVPHGEAMKYVPELIELGIKVIDLSADYRLKKETYEKVYGRKHEGYIEAAYGLPELFKDEIKKSNLVANPGCYPTGTILAIAPLVKKDLISSVHFDCKSGITGAGAKASDFTHYPNLHEAITPYKVINHRHYPEILEVIEKINPEVKIDVHFTPHVFPGSRGILTTAYIEMKEKISQEELKSLFKKFYSACPFIRIQDEIKLSWVRGSNFCDIAIYSNDRTVICSAIDNLVKGASGQAIQNMNIMFRFDEKEGLYHPPLFP